MKKKVTFLLLVILVISCLTSTASANSAKPPDLTVIVINAPKDIALNIISGETINEGRKKTYYGLTYFSFGSLRGSEACFMEITAKGTTLTVPIGEQFLGKYESIITFDYHSHVITEGKFIQRTILIIAANVILTLLIEGLVFFIFGFRKKVSWGFFVVVNLVTQLFLNAILYSDSLFFNSYFSVSIYLVEFIVMIIEIFSFMYALKEHTKLRRFSYAVIANLASFIAGNYILNLLPF